MLTLLVFILILSVLVFVHEFGHFIVAKKSGIKVEEFGFGLPPRVFGVKRGETVYSINALPIGGFVRLAGEELPSGKAEVKQREFWSKPKRIRFAVAIAGVVMNFLLAIIVFGAIYTKVGIPTSADKVILGGVAPSSPAAQAGLKAGDVVVAAGGEKIDGNAQKFVEVTQKFSGRSMAVEVLRDSQDLKVEVTPRQNPPQGEGPLGVELSNVEMKFYPFWQMPFRGIIEGVKTAFIWITLIGGGLITMIWNLTTTGAVPKDIAGPVGIYQITGAVAQGGILNVLQFLGILSINLAVINILPFPALDGGRLLFILIEAVSRRRVRANIENLVHQIGMMLLLLLLALLTYNDILRIVGASSLGETLRRLFQ